MQRSIRKYDFAAEKLLYKKSRITLNHKNKAIKVDRKKMFNWISKKNKAETQDKRTDEPMMSEKKN